MDKPSFFNKVIEPIIPKKKTHDRDAAEYDEKHVEIYNPTEQKRIRFVLKDALSYVKLKSDLPRVLDFGAGTGNLTEHLLDLGVKTVAADISSKYLERLRLKLGNSERLETILLNGDDLSGIPDGSFDMVATYSVLHHVPDYLKIIDEFVRVLKTGGILYIDHEVCPTYWESNSEYDAYLEELGPEFSKVHRDELGLTLRDEKITSGTTDHKSIVFRKWIKQIKSRPSSHKRRKIRKGGDLHVFKDDHIMWGDIESRLHSKCEIINNYDYLVCRERDETPEIWRKWKDKCSDMHVIIARKIESGGP
ncbi:MAG TPA: class I SAM-dependent methyltransferase [Nitrospirota bacterium]|nr:class I SAM-dependent methyltransferase [Nitrospirota bacterium]